MHRPCPACGAVSPLSPSLPPPHSLQVGREYEGRLEAAAPAAATAHSSLDSDVDRYTAEVRESC